MKATNIYFTDKHLKSLRQEKKETGVNVSEIIRRLLDKHFEEKESNKTK